MILPLWRFIDWRRPPLLLQPAIYILVPRSNIPFQGRTVWVESAATELLKDSEFPRDGFESNGGVVHCRSRIQYAYRREGTLLNISHSTIVLGVTSCLPPRCLFEDSPADIEFDPQSTMEGTVHGSERECSFHIFNGRLFSIIMNLDNRHLCLILPAQGPI
ncbi:uncharacterized protein F5147DRAFT_690991 [Suillus discolor]|uniref:Uncharacterized protein n=1 Tax=Suillus discolor TaxID=1912936 RepID=A0A9P7F9F7_9AGAM|nr:uncharacterized protein F5147DRAFT_690991 [Suillus discolor]KAG2109955.1 hypothetical protein F5147DRAFT_690991 [Suillus discolor]